MEVEIVHRIRVTQLGLTTERWLSREEFIAMLLSLTPNALAEITILRSPSPDFR